MQHHPRSVGYAVRRAVGGLVEMPEKRDGCHR
jgi:hypothetical protein